LELPFLHDVEQTLVGYWIEAGQVTHTANGPTAITWGEVCAWADKFHSEQYVEWVEHPRPLRSDGLPDERFKEIRTPLLATQCTLPDWVLQAIKRMSQEYVGEFFNNSPSAPCPKEVIIDELTEDDKLANAKAFKSSFMSMFGKKTPAVEAVPK
jgi:hypothetical protein